MTAIEKRAEELRKRGATVQVITGGAIQSLLVTFSPEPATAATNVFRSSHWQRRGG